VGFASGGTAGLASGGTARLASGGMISEPVHGASGFTVIPGLPSEHDSVHALLAPGEVVLRNIQGRSPAGVVADLADLVPALRRLVQNEDSGGPARSGPANVTFNVKTQNASSFREDVRRGAFRRELRLFSELRGG
jgi:hypothetical protein